MPKSERRPGRIIGAFVGALVLIAAVSRLIWAGSVDSMDFVVYWKAAQTWIQGPSSPYAFSAADRGFVFKYPPFLLPLFLPFGFIGFGASKVIWALIELACLAYSFFWLLESGVRRSTAFLVTALFWWIWLAHFFAGQFTLVLLACALWAVGTRSRGSFRVALLGLVFTAKVFSVVTLCGVWRELWKGKTLLAGLGLLVASHAVLLTVAFTHGQPASVVLGYYPEWVRAALSGGQELGELVIRGQMNHGFTAGVLRWAGIEVTRSSMDVLVAIALFAVLGTSWAWISRRKRLGRAETWAGWLGVGLVTHPLAWHHSFVLAYPLCALSLEHAIRSGNRARIVLSALGIACIGILIPNVIGLTLVTPLELVSVKSWGVVLSAVSLLLSSDSEVLLPKREDRGTPRTFQ